MSILTPEQVLTAYLITVSKKNITNVCRDYPEYHNICKKDSFWKAKVAHDFGVEKQLPNYTWLGMWYYLSKNRIKMRIRFYFSDKKVIVPDEELSRYLAELFNPEWLDTVLEGSKCKGNISIDSVIIDRKDRSIYLIFKFAPGFRSKCDDELKTVLTAWAEENYDVIENKQFPKYETMTAHYYAVINLPVD